MESIVMHVAGMHCDGCAQRISTALGRVEGVRDVAADHTSGRVDIRIGPELTDRQALSERIELAGFQVASEEAPE